MLRSDAAAKHASHRNDRRLGELLPPGYNKIRMGADDTPHNGWRRLLPSLTGDPGATRRWTHLLAGLWFLIGTGCLTLAGMTGIAWADMTDLVLAAGLLVVGTAALIFGRTALRGTVAIPLLTLGFAILLGVLVGVRAVFSGVAVVAVLGAAVAWQSLNELAADAVPGVWPDAWTRPGLALVLQSLAGLMLALVVLVEGVPLAMDAVAGILEVGVNQFLLFDLGVGVVYAVIGVAVIVGGVAALHGRLQGPVVVGAASVLAVLTGTWIRVVERAGTTMYDVAGAVIGIGVFLVVVAYPAYLFLRSNRGVTVSPEPEPDPGSEVGPES